MICGALGLPSSNGCSRMQQNSFQFVRVEYSLQHCTVYGYYYSVTLLDWTPIFHVGCWKAPHVRLRKEICIGDSSEETDKVSRASTTDSKYSRSITAPSTLHWEIFSSSNLQSEMQILWCEDFHTELDITCRGERLTFQADCIAIKVNCTFYTYTDEIGCKCKSKQAGKCMELPVALWFLPMCGEKACRGQSNWIASISMNSKNITQ